MANTVKAITSDEMVSMNTRRIRGTLGADGALVVGEGLNEYDSITIQLTGTFDSSVQTVQVSNDGTNFIALPTALSFNAAAYKTPALADLGFYALQFSGASAGGNSAIAFTLFATRRGKRG